MSETDARGITVTRTVDALDRVTAVTYPSADLDIAYTYDDPAVPFSKGRLTRIARGGTAVDYRYDRFGRTLQDGELSYGYDANGNPTSLVYPGGVEAVTTFDFADRPASLLARRTGLPDRPLVTAAGYLPSGPLSSLALGNGLTETRAFDQRYFPSSITLAAGSNLLRWNYTTDAVGNILTISDALNAANNRTYTYQDHHYFLTQGNGPWGPRAWTYDKIGNRLTESRGATTDTYSYLPSVTGGRSPVLSQVQPGTGGPRTYQFGPASHLASVTSGGSSTLYHHDAASRLAWLSDTNSGTTFRYDGRDYLSLAEPQALPFKEGFESGDLCGWSDAAGTTNSLICPALEPAVRPTYSSEGVLHALSRTGLPERIHVFYFAGRPVAQLDLEGGTEIWKYLTTDHLGTPIAATNVAGQMVWSGGFEPFGTDWQGAGATGIFLRFPGQWEEEAWDVGGLQYNLHRWYEEQLGRYSQPDPLSRVPLSFRHGLLLARLEPLYAYAYGNPLRFIDPLGLASLERALCINRWTLAGVGIGSSSGAVVGAVSAGSACTLVVPGAGTAGCGVGGAWGGALAGGAIGGSLGAFFGSLVCPDDCSDDSDERRRIHDHCLRLYEICVATPGRHKFVDGARCGDCFHNCRAQGVWPFERCKLNYYPHGV